MDAKSELREFLTTRRGRITPEQAGLRTYGTGPRRVPGLRREEVALLAGVSVDYYTRLERGNVAGVSEQVLDAIARALQLDDVERTHLFDLARPQKLQRRRKTVQRVRPGVLQLLNALDAVPAFVRNGRLDILAASKLGRALYSPHFESLAQPVNTARFLFLDPAAQAFYLDWERISREAVAILRAEAGRDPYDRDLTDLVGELSTRSDAFRTLWAAHDVHRHSSGEKRFHHPVVGDLTVSYEAMELVTDPGLTMWVYTAEPGTASAEALALLGSWTATIDEETQRADHASDARHWPRQR